MIHADVHGLSWPIIYWLLATLAGILLDASNIRHAWAQIRNVRSGELEERPLRASAVGYLVLHLAVAVFLAIAAVTGLGLLVGSLTSGLMLTFSSQAGEELVIGLALCVPTVPALIAALFWVWRTAVRRALLP